MPAPANDNFANATALTGASGSVTGTTLLATAQAGEPGHLNYNPAPAYPVAPAVIAAANSVWYSWTCPATGDYFFSTRDLTGGMATNYKSTVQVFTGSAVNALTAVTLLLNQSVGDGNGADNGASVAFAATSGTVYKIQIDGRRGETGDFTLRWDAYIAMRMGSCGGCAIDFKSEICVGTVAITDVEIDDVYSFGTFDADPGFYKIKYCGGAFAVLSQFATNVPSGISGYMTDGVGYSGSISIWDGFTVYSTGDQVLITNNAFHQTFVRAGVFTATGATAIYDPAIDTADWTADTFNPHPVGSVPYNNIYTPERTYAPGDGGFINITVGPTGFGGDYYSVTSPTVSIPAYKPGFGSSPWAGSAIDFLNTTLFSSAGLAERANLCTEVQLEHLGGDIGMAFPTKWTLVSGPSPHLETLYQNTSNNPRFQLIYNPFTIAMLNNTPGFSITGSGTSWTFTPTIKNLAANAWSNCTIELLNTGGISGASSPNVVTLAASANTSGGAFTCTADPTAGLVTATIQISRNGIVVGTLDYPLYPIYSVAFTLLNDIERTCTGFKYWKNTIVATKLWPPNNMDQWGSSTTLGIDSSTGLPSKNQLIATFSVVAGTPNLYAYNSCTSVVSIVANQLGSFSNITMLPGIQATASVQSVPIQFTFGFKVSSTVTHALPTFTQTLSVPVA